MGNRHGGRLIDGQLRGDEAPPAAYAEGRRNVESVQAISGAEEPCGEDGGSDAASGAEDADEGKLGCSGEHEYGEGLRLPYCESACDADGPERQAVGAGRDPDAEGIGANSTTSSWGKVHMRQGATATSTPREQSSAERIGERVGQRVTERAWGIMSRLPRARRRPRLSPVAGVQRGLATLGLVWEGLWLLPDPTLWPTNQASVHASVLVAGVFVTWLAVVLTGVGSWASPRLRFKAQATNVSLLFAAALVLLIDAPAGSAGAWQPGASLLNLACALAGLLLVMRVAIPLIVGAALVELGILAVELSQASTSGDWMSALLYPVYALAMGAAAVGARHGLFAAARRSEGARAALERAEAQSQALRGLQRRMREQQRLLHETVLNTLTAIARGGVGHSSEIRSRMRERCAESAIVLRALASAEFSIPSMGTRDWAADLRPGTQPLVDSGVLLDISVQPGGGRLPDEVYGAMVGAAREALSNVARHAQAETVVMNVSVATDARARRQRWTVEIRDDGIGFDSESAPSRFGVSSAILQTMEDAGGVAHVTSSVGNGTSVTLTWMTAPESRASVALGESATSVNALGAPVLLSFGVFSLLSLLLTMPGYQYPTVAAVGFSIAFVCGGLLIWFGRARALPSILVLGICIVVPLVYRLQIIGLGAGESNSWSDWSSEAIVALLLIVAGTGPWWGWIAALAAWLLTQGDMVAELLRPGTAVIVAGALFARSVRSNDRAYAAAMRQRVREEASSAGDEASLRAMARRYSALSESCAATLLEDIAGGSADPDDAGVQASCAFEEQFIRTVMRIDPASSSLQALVLQLAIRAHHRQVELHVDIGEAPALGGGRLLMLRLAANRVIGCALPGVPARLSARFEGEGFVLRLVASVAEVDRPLVVGLPDVKGIAWHADPEQQEILLEAMFP